MIPGISGNKNYIYYESHEDGKTPNAYYDPASIKKQRSVSNAEHKISKKYKSATIKIEQIKQRLQKLK